MEVRAPAQIAMADSPAPPKYFAYQVQRPPTPHNPTGVPMRDFPGGAFGTIFYAGYCSACAIADVAEEVEPGTWCCTYLLSSNCACFQPCIFADRRNKLAAKYGITIPCVHGPPCASEKILQKKTHDAPDPYSFSYSHYANTTQGK